MPRQAREKSKTGIYHVMLRGINRQDIFYDVEDRVRFVYTLKKYKPICEYELYGYCLMDNHVHLLIKEGKEDIGQIMKRIGASYVYWYNEKYERYGHLFQDRFKSECVESDTYLLVVLRYIHQNPIKAGVTKVMEDYKWSSYIEYISKGESVVDKEFVLGIINTNPEKTLKIFKKFMKEENKDQCLDVKTNDKKSFTDQQAKQIILDHIQSNDLKILKEMDKNNRNIILAELKEQGISIRQISRITGLGRGIVERAGR